MRYQEFITEKWFNTYNVEGRQIDVYINPTKSEFLKLLANLEKKHGTSNYPLRAFVTPTDLYIWDAYFATHGDMTKHDIPQSGGYLYLNRDGILFNDLNMEYGDDPDKPYGPWLRRYYIATITNPSILRIYGPDPKITGVDDEGAAGFTGYFPITAEFIEKYVE